MHVRILLGLSLCLFVIPSGAQTKNLLHNGDFETATKQSPPSGWAMWGAEQWKNPQNYTRDTGNAHSGKASLRIYHPANSAGYIVAAPQQNNAIEIQQGMAYDISFWAKTDHPGTAHFEAQVLNSIQPIVACPVTLGRNIEVGTEWKQFTLHATEGIDFSTPQCRYLMLAFIATPFGENPNERTLWVDDIMVEAKPSPTAIRYTPINHRLQPGNELRLTVDANRKLRHTTREAGSVSFHRVNGYMNLPYNAQGEYKLTAEQEAAIRDLHLPWTRFYGLGDEPFSLESAIDKAANTLNHTGIPQDGSVLELEDQGAVRKLEPEAWARGVAYSVQKGYKFRYWEISNEPWGTGGNRKYVFPSAEDYIAHVKEVSPVIRRAQPNSQIGIAVEPRYAAWSNNVLQATAGQYDFVVPHWYSFIDVKKNPFEMVVAGENYRLFDQMLHLNALLKAYNPNRNVYQYDTEWSLHSSASGSVRDTVQNGNIVGVLHRAVRLIYYTREDIVKGASGWEMFSNAGDWNPLSLLPPDSDRRSMLYWLHRSFNTHVGDWVLDMQGTTPYYQPTAPSDIKNTPLPGPLAPVLVTLSADGKTIYIIAVNASWTQSIPCTAEVKNFKIAATSGTLLSSSNPGAQPLLEKKEDLVSSFPVQRHGGTITCTLPPHSVAFLTLQK